MQCGDVSFLSVLRQLLILHFLRVKKTRLCRIRFSKTYFNRSSQMRQSPPTPSNLPCKIKGEKMVNGTMGRQSWLEEVVLWADSISFVRASAIQKVSHNTNQQWHQNPAETCQAEARSVGASRTSWKARSSLLGLSKQNGDQWRLKHNKALHG